MLKQPLALALALVLPVACGSSSAGGPPGGGDGGGGPGNVISPVSDASGVGNVKGSCGQLGAVLGGAPASCAAGQTCCTTVSIANFSASSTCVPIGQCSGVLSNECYSATSCSGGAVCCAGAATTDASTEAGGGGIGGLASSLDTTCQPACEPGQRQACASDAECPAGQVCSAAAAGGGAAGGGVRVCAAPPPDAGSADSAGGDASGE